MSAERELLRQLQQALETLDTDADELVRAAWEEARRDVQIALRRMMTHLVLTRCIESLDQSPASRAPQASPATTPPRREEAATTGPDVATAVPGTTSTYVFGFTLRAVPTLPLAELPVLPGGGPLRTIACGEVQAIVCDIHPSALAVLATPGLDGLDGLDTLSTLAHAHDAVLAEVARATTVLPLRLGTALRDDDAVMDLLNRHAQNLRDELTRLEHHAEWAVTVRLLDDPNERSAPPAATPSAGRDYMEQRRVSLQARERHWNGCARLASAIHERLAARATEAVTVRPRPRDDVAPPLLHGVYLLAEEQRAGFEQAVQEARRHYEATVLEVTGPWPPYHFAAVDLGSGGAAVP